jgi:hypothetical protein
LLGPTDLLPQELGLVIEEFVQGDGVGNYVVQQVFLVAVSFQVSHAGLPNWGSDGGRKIPYRCGDEVFLVDPAQVAEGFSEGQSIGVSVSKSCGGQTPWLDVGVAVASSDGQDHPTAKSAELLILSAVVPRALRDTEALQGVDKKASKTRLLLAHALGPSIFRHLKNKGRVEQMVQGGRVQKIDSFFSNTVGVHSGLAIWNQARIKVRIWKR